MNQLFEALWKKKQHYDLGQLSGQLCLWQGHHTQVEGQRMFFFGTKSKDLNVYKTNQFLLINHSIDLSLNTSRTFVKLLSCNLGQLLTLHLWQSNITC